MSGGSDAAAEVELACAFDSCALFDRSDLGRLIATGPDLLELLHRLSTGDVKDLEAGAGRPTVLTTPKGRIVERLFVHHLGDSGVMLVGGSSCGPRVAAHLDRFTFAEQTGLGDVTTRTYQLALIGPATSRALELAGLERPGAHGVGSGSIAGKRCHLLGQDGSGSGGCSVVGDAADAAEVRSALEAVVRQVGGRPASNLALESYRVLCGLPASGHELTERHNPLEAGLWDAVSFDKGCYVGQEVVARLRTYDKVSRSLVGLELPCAADPPRPETPLLLDGREVGVVTSALLPPGRTRPVGLGYVKRRDTEDVGELQAGEDGPSARIVELPFERPR